MITLSRRLRDVDELVDDTLSNYRDTGMVFDDEYEFFTYVCEDVIHKMYYRHFSHLDDSKEGWGLLYNLLEEYIRDEHGRKIDKFFDQKLRDEST